LETSWPALSGRSHPAVEALDVGWARDLDVVFLALPHGVSGGYVRALHAEGLLADPGRPDSGGLRVIDLGADFRLKDPATYEATYGGSHPSPELLAKAVYGLPEQQRDALPGAVLVANPGCYPTATALGAQVLLAAGCAGPVHTTCVSGVSGAGRKAGPRTLFCEVHDSAVAYGVGGSHRHVPEMEQLLKVPVMFTPHLVSMNRGMLATVSMSSPVALRTEALWSMAEEMYGQEELIVLRDSPPATRDVRGTGLAHIHVVVDAQRHVAQALVAIDNVGKGAASQAVQNLNLVFGMPETLGIPTIPLVP
jgi:N-acetyl-gamma-glutamyl-phosphate reductase